MPKIPLLTAEEVKVSETDNDAIRRIVSAERSRVYNNCIDFDEKFHYHLLYVFSVLLHRILMLGKKNRQIVGKWFSLACTHRSLCSRKSYPILPLLKLQLEYVTSPFVCAQRKMTKRTLFRKTLRGIAFVEACRFVGCFRRGTLFDDRRTKRI